jgi:hypothetical protein
MLNKACSNIPRELCAWITILGKSLPLPAVRTCLELLIGAMPTRSGLVTQSWAMLNTQKHWTSYYKYLQTHWENHSARPAYTTIQGFKG